MSRTYTVIWEEDARERGLPGLDPMPPSGWYEPAYQLWRCEDGEPVELIGQDGAEPEDQILVRAWSWVGPALERAYAEGAASVAAERDAAVTALERLRPVVEAALAVVDAGPRARCPDPCTMCDLHTALIEAGELEDGS